MIPHRPPHIHPNHSTIFLTGRIYSGISWIFPEHTKQYALNKLVEIMPTYHMTLDAYVICHNHYHLLAQVTHGALVPKFIKHFHGATAHYIKQNLPEIVTVGGQILTRDITPWDKRQTIRLNTKINVLRRELKLATTEKQKYNVLAQFIAHHPIITRKLKSATTDSDVSANFNSLPNVLAQFIAHPDVLVLLTSQETPIWYQYMDHIIRNETDYYKHLNYIHQNSVKHGLTKRLTEYKWSSIHTWIKNKGKEFVVDCFHRYPIRDFQPLGCWE